MRVFAKYLTIQGIPHLDYTLIHADVVIEDRKYETYLCMSEYFKESGESKLALDTYYQVNANVTKHC